MRGTCTEDMVCACPERWTGADCNTPGMGSDVTHHARCTCTCKRGSVYCCALIEALFVLQVMEEKCYTLNIELNASYSP